MVKIVARVASALLLVSYVAMIVSPSAVAAVAAPASRAPVGVLAGYMWSANYPSRDFDSQAGSTSVVRSSKGAYDVTFRGLSLMRGGIVQVTPYHFAGTCSISGWGPTGGLLVNVNCYSLAGHPKDALFDLIVTQPTSAPPGAYDYAWVNQDAFSGRIDNSYQYNSAGKGNTVRHLGIGRYQVTFEGPASSGTHGTVKVSAYGVGGGDCAASGWHGTNAGQVVDVDCYTVSGHLVNRQFNVTYARRTNLIGLAGYPVANALVGATGRVLTQFNSQAGARVTASRVGPGLYKVQLNRITEHFSGGDVQVSPITGSQAHCVVVRWTGGSNVKVIVTVHCFNGHGHSVSSEFAVQFVEAFLT